ncbi:HD domain-containing protein [Streptomyces sp. NPDC050625]|uniref:HD domain-containing protein n=1 Tax=Streptomyces sp. NPDC050625 TaxID=3154629 RepID=UPI00341AE155
MTLTNVLSIAVDETWDPPLRPLPPRAAELLHRLDAPPRLVAHLRAVHDVAARLADWAQEHCPAMEFDRDAVLFGAATHDIGKTLHPGELTGPGARHEEAGRELLLAHGVDAALARFAGTHASWDALEDLVVARLSRAGGRPDWEEFLVLDEVLTAIGEDADRRLAYQMSHPVTRR